MLNFRKLKQEFSPSILKEGRQLFSSGMVESTKIIHMNKSYIRLSSRVAGNFENSYESEIEIDRLQSTSIDSNCDCPYSYDCQHLAAILFHLEKNLDDIVVTFSKETDLEEEDFDDTLKEELRETFEQAQNKENLRKGKKYQKETLEEYSNAYSVLGKSHFFHPPKKFTEDSAKLAVIFIQPPSPEKKYLEVQLALRIPFRSKPLHIPNFKNFCEAVSYQEQISISNRDYFFTFHSFDEYSRNLLRLIITHTQYNESHEEQLQRTAKIPLESFGHILTQMHNLVLNNPVTTEFPEQENNHSNFPCLYSNNLETPLRFSPHAASLRFNLECLDTPTSKIFLTPQLILDLNRVISPKEAILMESVHPGIVYNNVYYYFSHHIKRTHLRDLEKVKNVAIPKPLFGTFVENSLPELLRYAKVTNLSSIENFATLPFVGQVKAHCDIHYLDGELDATLYFLYEKIKIPASSAKLSYSHTELFLTKQGILARDLLKEQEIIHSLFQNFFFDKEQGIFSAKTEKKIVEFMTEVIPNNQSLVTFQCPKNLLDQFTYDKTSFTITLKETSSIHTYTVDFKVNGKLRGVKTDLLWECLSSKKPFIEFEKHQEKGKKSDPSKILILDLEKLAPLIQLFDDLGIKKLENQQIERSLWSLSGISKDSFSDLLITFSISKKLQDIQKQILGKIPLKHTPIPKDLNASLRNYQKEGIYWLDRLRYMHLNGILADDMGLGKTLQAITIITQYKKENPTSLSLIVCPTSLLYNWKEEFSKFHPKTKTLIVDGTPTQRKTLFKKITNCDVIITSYSLIQKDIEIYKKISFGYAILDEAQHIKNRSTRNAKSVKLICANHRLILTGTPIENSLEELWSLFDFLMPGLLNSFNRFVEKYLRNNSYGDKQRLENLRKKLSPFILRRMKKDVLKDLPPISDLLYHCHLTADQQNLYESYVKSARKELSDLVSKKGFNKVQVHVLATLTRLKQICCHPAIFAKEKAEPGDSAKYDMLMELLQTLVEGQHKTVIFSQYTKMLNIIRKDLEKLGMRFSYLDGSSKDRLKIVNTFNNDPAIPIFLVSLKAGGSGLNITGADTVIHYDIWWNPAVENQATDRVHRIGQVRSVSSYKLVTLNTIEEKILQLQNRKKHLVKQMICNDDEAMSKLTWEEVLELLQT